MSQPKKKTSRSRRNMRRYAAGKRIDTVTLLKCPACGEATRPHRVCGCGQYAGKEVLPAPAATQTA